MIFQAVNNIKSLITSNLSSFVTLNKPRRDFFIEIMLLFLTIPSRMNFLQFGRYGKFGEQRYRLQFEKQFDFLTFNKEIILSHGSDELIIAFDPSYISKSGKHTPGVDKYWSGVAGQAKLGLEIGGIAAIDIKNNTAFHIEAIQTPTHDEISEQQMTLPLWYADILIQRKDSLLAISKHLVVDAYFSKKTFIDKMLDEANLHVISRFRKDADLYYLYSGKPTGKRGRPKKYAGKIDLKNIDQQYFECLQEGEDTFIYSAIVYSKSLKRKVKLVILDQKNNKSNLLYFSTDLELATMKILHYYRKRFQIEFLYRDGKQHTGLNDSQARSGNKLHFHFNASLTSINLAKVQHWLSIPKEERNSFSMADVKTMYHNSLLIQRFIDVFAVPPYKLKNNNNIKELINFGKIAA